jgi:hypothetical protein
MRTLVRAGRVLVVPTVALAAALLLAPGRAELAIHVYALVLLAIALGAVVSAISRSQGNPGPSEFDAALQRPEKRCSRPPELARLERATELARSSSYDLHYRLRPVLREIAVGLLAVRRGVDLDREPARARALLGEETWELVRLDREPPHDRYGPGIEAAALGRVIGSLEAL